MRRAISVLLALGLLVISSAGPPIYKAEGMIIRENEKKAGNEEKAEANERIYSIFEVGEDGLWIYPSGFAGTYGDEECLVLYLSKVGERERSIYEDALGEYLPYVKIIRAAYSLSELDQMTAQLASLVLEGGVKLAGSYSDPKEGKIVLCVPHREMERTRMLVSQSQFEKETKIIEQELFQPESTLRGGDSITCVQSGAGLTLGACGRMGLTYSTLTCAHNINSVGNTFRRTAESNTFGYVSTKVFPPLNGSSAGDYSITTVYSGHALEPVVWIEADYTSQQGIYGTRLSFYNGEILSRYGRVTHWGTVKVSAINSSVYYYEGDNYYHVTGMVWADVITVPSTGGDSGGPYFKATDSGLHFAGIHSGSNGTGTVFTPYSVIYNATGFVPLLDQE